MTDFRCILLLRQAYIFELYVKRRIFYTHFEKKIQQIFYLF
jgi:hypothetical protein